ncbi:MAG: hypothetical protein V4582_18565 [Pseudomonadota bacterium]
MNRFWPFVFLFCIYAQTAFARQTPSPCVVSDVTSAHAYYGDCKDGKAHGDGRIEFANGRRFSGVFVEGYRATGTMEIPPSLAPSLGWVRYAGGWKNGDWSGDGKVEFRTNCTYAGEFAYGLFEGKGTYQCPGQVADKGPWVKGVSQQAKSEESITNFSDDTFALLDPKEWTDFPFDEAMNERHIEFPWVAKEPDRFRPVELKNLPRPLNQEGTPLCAAEANAFIFNYYSCKLSGIADCAHRPATETISIEGLSTLYSFRGVRNSMFTEWFAHHDGEPIFSTWQRETFGDDKTRTVLTWNTNSVHATGVFSSNNPLLFRPMPAASCFNNESKLKSDYRASMSRLWGRNGFPKMEGFPSDKGQSDQQKWATERYNAAEKHIERLAHAYCDALEHTSSEIDIFTQLTEAIHFILPSFALNIQSAMELCQRPNSFDNRDVLIAALRDSSRCAPNQERVRMPQAHFTAVPAQSVTVSTPRYANGAKADNLTDISLDAVATLALIKRHLAAGDPILLSTCASSRVYTSKRTGNTTCLDEKGHVVVIVGAKTVCPTLAVLPKDVNACRQVFRIANSWGRRASDGSEFEVIDAVSALKANTQFYRHSNHGESEETLKTLFPFRLFAIHAEK